MTDITKRDLPGSLADTIENSDLASLGQNLTEVGIDSILNDGILKDLPIVGTLVGIWKAGISIKDAIFFRKLQAFLTGLADVPPVERARIISLLNNQDATESAGEKLLTLLERIDSVQKAHLLGESFKLLAADTISIEEFWRVSFILDRLPLSDIQALKEWSQTDLNDVKHVRKHLYLSSGVGWFVLDAFPIGFQWETRLCTIFSDHLIN